MDFITATLVALVLATLTVLTAAFNSSNKPSLGPTYAACGGAHRYWGMITVNIAVHATVFSMSPMWFSATLITLALAGLGFHIYWAAQLRKSQRRVKAIFEQAAAESEARRKAALADIDAKRAKLAEAHDALDKGYVERATRLAAEARDLA